MFKGLAQFSRSIFRSMFQGILIVLLVLGSGGYPTLAQVIPSQPPESYQQAVEDAAIVEPDEIVETLIAITPENEDLVWNADHSKLLVVTWKSQGSYQKFIEPYTHTSDNENYVVWVTTVPQVKAFCQQYVQTAATPNDGDLNMRLRQYLGLGADWQYDVFVELWVSPEDLFRPCVDPEINDSRCELSFGSNTPGIKNITDYPEFYKTLYYRSYRQAPGVPWTGLGYTYDWNPESSEVGASEFILVPGATYEIHQVLATATYCQLP